MKNQRKEKNLSKWDAMESFSEKDLRRLGYQLHHKASAGGHLPKRFDKSCEPYGGRFGVGVKRHLRPKMKTERRHIVEYWILPLKFDQKAFIWRIIYFLKRKHI